MDLDSLTRWRWPAAAVLLLIALVVFWPRGGADEASTVETPRPSIGVGQVGGDVATPSQSIAVTPIPTLTPNASPSPTAMPQAQDGFDAEVLACRSISGDDCNDQLGTLSGNASSFTALVRFTDANAGDQLNTVLSGPSGTIAGFPYSLQGGGDGYYYSEFQTGSLPAGDYTLTATRNGEPVATTAFRVEGG
jgi:hypothetical protein